MAPIHDEAGRSGGRPDGTVVLSDRTVIMTESGSFPLIFAWLVEEEKERVYRIHSDVFTIGSAASCQLTLNAPDVKDLHCSIYFVDDRFEINDNNSKTGTWVNQAAVKRQWLNDDDLISVGSRRFRFKCFRENRHG